MFLYVYKEFARLSYKFARLSTKLGWGFIIFVVRCPLQCGLGFHKQLARFSGYHTELVRFSEEFVEFTPTLARFS